MNTADNAMFHIVLVQGVALKDGKALLAQRSFDEIQSPGLWSLPGGKVEHTGDALNVIEQTLAAEFAEEVGITLKPIMRYLRSGSFTRKDGASVLALTFAADWASGEAAPLEDSIAVRWVDLAGAQELELAPGVIESLELVLT